MLAKEGDYGNAARVLGSSGIEMTLRRVCFHSSGETLTALSEYRVLPDSLPPFSQFTSELVLHFVQSFPRVCAAGGSGLLPNHLVELL